MTAQSVILIFHMPDKNRRLGIEMALFPSGIPIRYVKQEEYQHPLGYLAGQTDLLPGEPDSGPEFPDEMMLFCGVPDDKLEQILAAFRALSLPPVNYKAVLTDANRYWTARQLFSELKREHEAMNP